MSMQPWYTTRESVARALDVKATARADWQIDEAIEAASRLIEQCTNRIFYPWTGTRYFDWPDPQNGSSYVLWLEENEAISVSALTSGGTAIATNTYNVEPVNQAPPFDRIELKLSGPASFGLSNTHQRDVAVTGVFGYANDERPAAMLTAAISDTTSTTIHVSGSRSIGVGSLLRVDSERMIVTDVAFADSTQDLQADIAAANNVTALTVTDGSVFQSGEVILLDAEKMRVDTVAGNVLVVTRAWDGTVLALHSGSSIYRETTLTVERGSVGTTAATHLNAASVFRWHAPGPITTLCRAQAIDTILQEEGGYARLVGSGDNARNASGAALANLWDRVEEEYRRVRLGVI